MTYEEIESNQRQHNDLMLHNERVCNEHEQHVYAIFNILKPMWTKDGNSWVVLYGENLQVGVAGFGDSLHEAVMNWFENLHEKIKQPE